MDNLPIEMKEMIIFFCDGESLHHIRQLNRHWKLLVDQEDERRNLFKRCLKSEIDKEVLKDLVNKMYPKKSYLYSNPSLYKTVFCANLLWKYFSNNDIKTRKISHKFSEVIDLKVSGNTVLIGDQRGLYVMNSLNHSLIFHDLGRVKNIELYCTNSKPKNSNYEYDEADVTTENNIHHFYDLHKKTFCKSKNYYEKKYLKYWNGKSIELDMNEFFAADFYENYVIMVNRKHVIRAKDSSLSKVHKTPFNCQGARAWFLWHSRLVMCSKDDGLSIFVDGKTRIINYNGFPPVTAIHYYAGWLFLGCKYGVLYGYHIHFEKIHLLDLNKSQINTKICDAAIVKVDVIQQDTLLTIIVASDEEIFLLCNTKELLGW